MLPSSGQISLDDIRIELGIPTQAPFNLYDAVHGTYVAINTCSAAQPSTTPPHSLTDWYSYNHSAACLTLINVVNSSLDISISAVLVNGVNATYVSGQTLPVIAGTNGIYSTTQFGTYDIAVTCNTSIGGQNVSINDSASNNQCFDVSGFSTKTKTGSTITSGLDINITAADGACA